MKKINFYDYEIAVESCHDKFGIIEPANMHDCDNNSPVQISFDITKEKDWNATVDLNYRNDYKFIAVDKKIPLTKRVNGQVVSASSCDAILHTENTICFIELKATRKSSVEEACKQIKSTVDFFGKKNINTFKERLAYICNSKKDNPAFYYSDKILRQKFKSETKLILHCKCEIKEFRT